MKRLKHRSFLLCTLVIILSHSPSYSQSISDTTSSGKSIRISIYTGTLVPHHDKLKPLKNGLIRSIELSYRINRNNDELWNRYYSYPEVGISYMFMDYAYRNVLGYSHSLYPYIDFPITANSKPLWLTLKVAIGASYITKVYDSISNKENIAISSHLNLFALFGLKFNFKLTNGLTANIGVNATHFSNGSIKKPNYGLNLATTSLGVNYNFGKCMDRRSNIKSFECIKNRWLVVLSGAVKEVKGPGGPKYGVGSISLEYSKAFRTLLRLGISFDYMYDGSTFGYFREESVQYDSRLKASKLGLTIMGEMALNRLSAFANFGTYLYNYNTKDDPVYQRIGLRYRFNRFLYTQVALKTHLNVADYLEWGIIIRLPKNNRKLVLR
jgi:hypothetical protein